MFIVILGATAVLGLYMAWNIGANDFANSMGDAVGSGAISIRTAVIFGSLCELAGSVLVGSHVTDTVRRGIVNPDLFSPFPQLLMLGMICALLGTALWLNLATWLGMPVSTTHAVVGAVAGLGIAAVGFSAVDWRKMGEIAASWLISPVAGGILSFILFKLITGFILGQEKPLEKAVRYTPIVTFCVVAVVVFSTLYKGLARVLAEVSWLTAPKAVLFSLGLAVIPALFSRFFIGRTLRGQEDKSLSEQLRIIERVFVPFVVLTSCSVAFAHGANDVANAIGPLAVVADILASGTTQMGASVPVWILLLGGIGIVLGLVTYGYKVMETVGTKITQLTPSRGVAAELATTVIVLVCTLLKLPVSTTHTIVGAIIGVGFARGLGAINRKVIRDIFSSWFTTVPAAAVLTIGLFLLGRLLHLDGWIKQALPPR